MIEKGKLPDNSENIIRKLEQFFQIRLRKISDMERMIARQEKKPFLLNDEGKNITDIPEDTFEIEDDEKNNAPQKTSFFKKIFPFFNGKNKEKQSKYEFMKKQLASLDNINLHSFDIFEEE